MKAHIKIVLGLNNGAIHICTDGVWRNEFGYPAEWLENALAKRPNDWQILFDGEVETQ